VELVADIDSDAIVVVAAILFAIATVGINVVLNFVSPSYDISNVAPKYISFRTGGIITAVLSVAVLPWKIWGNEAAIVYFLGGVGALMGPVFGILVVDYYLLRRQRTNTADLYSESTEGAYYYARGFNPAALIALGVSGAAAVAIALAPSAQSLTALSWPAGALLGGALMYVLSRRSGRATRATPS
jgi:NCS1 family nucleobase:cation symporter-1